MPISPRQYAKAAEGEIDRMSELLDSHQERLERSIQSLDQDIRRSLQQLDVGPDGNIRRGMPSLKFKREYRRQLLDLYEKKYSKTARDITSDFMQHLDGYNKFLDATDAPSRFTERDLRDLEDALNYTYEDLGLLGDESRRQVEDAVRNGIMTGAALSEVEEEIRAILAGTADDVGTLLADAGQVAHDGEMQWYADLNNKAAIRGGMDRFLYSGSIIGSSRAFCIARAGRIFQRKEIDAWNSYSWRGKSCNVWICRGGYNCRHQLLPVPSTIDEAPVSSWFDEEPMKPKLREAVSKEERRVNRIREDVGL